MDEYLHVITTKTHIQVMKANQVHLYVLFNIDTLNWIIFAMNNIYFYFFRNNVYFLNPRNLRELKKLVSNDPRCFLTLLHI